MLTAQETAGPVQGAARADGGEHVGRSSSRTSCARCSTSPTASPCCGAARRSTRSRREGATEASLAKLMVGRDVLFRLEKEERQGRRAAARDRRPARARRPRACRPCAGSRCRSARARSSASPASTATASPSWSRRSPGCASPTAGRIRVDGERRSPAAASGRAARGHRPHRRGPPPARPRPGLHAGREPRAARVQRAPLRASGCSRRKRMERQARAAARAVRRARRRAADARLVALRRQPAEVS